MEEEVYIVAKRRVNKDHLNSASVAGIDAIEKDLNKVIEGGIKDSDLDKICDALDKVLEEIFPHADYPQSAF